MASSLSFGVSSPFCHDHTPAGKTAFDKSAANRSDHVFESGCAFNADDSPACVTSREFNKATTTTIIICFMLRADYLIGLAKSITAHGHSLFVGGDEVKLPDTAFQRNALTPLADLRAVDRKSVV